MSAETGRPKPHEWRRAITSFVCNVSNLPEPLQTPALGLDMSPLIDGLAEALAPLIDRVEEQARAEGAASVAGPVLALADEWDEHQSDQHKGHASRLRAAIPADAAEAVARVKAKAWGEGWRAAQEVVELDGQKVWAHTVFPEGYEGNPYRTEAGGDR